VESIPHYSVTEVTSLPYPRFPKCFLSGSFSQEDKTVFEWFRKIAEAVELEVITGEEPSVSPLAETVKSLIRDSDGFIALLTRRDKIEGSAEWRPPTWVEQEIALAYSMNKPMTVFVEKGVKVEGLDPHVAKYERFAREDLSAAAPTAVRYLTELKNRLSPPPESVDDIATLRALFVEILTIYQRLQAVSQESNVFYLDLAYLTARASGRLYTLTDQLQQAVSDAYGAAESVRSLVDRIEVERGDKSWHLDDKPHPPLPPQHPLILELATTKEASLRTIRKSIYLMLKYAYPEKWEEFRLRFETLPDSPEKSEWKELTNTEK
jgi:hypothetical protein